MQPYSGYNQPASRRQAHVVFSALLGLVMIISVPGASAEEVCIKELGKAPQNNAAFPPFISPNGERVAFRSNQGRPVSLVCNDKEGPAWDDIPYVGISAANPFTADGKRLPYQARRGNEMFLLFAGEEDKPLATPGAQRAVYSRDGAHYAYTITSSNQQWIVLDGKEGPRYKRVYSSSFSPDGKRFAYTAVDARSNAFIVLDGQPLKAYEKAEYLRFSADSKRVVYVGVRDGIAMVVCDGKEGKPYSEALYPIFSPDSKSLAYWTRSADRKTHTVVWDEKEVVQMTGEPRLEFSPDSRTLACGTYSGEMYRFGNNQNERLAAGFESASQPVFSPDGKHIAFAVGRDMKWQISVDGKSFAGRYDPAHVKFWDGPAGGGSRMTLDAPGFSADGKHVFAIGYREVKQERGRPAMLYFIICDGMQGPSHEGLWLPVDFQNNAKSLRYVVRDGEQLRLMEWPWPKDKTWQDAIEWQTL